MEDPHGNEKPKNQPEEGKKKTSRRKFMRTLDLSGPEQSAELLRWNQPGSLKMPKPKVEKNRSFSHKTIN